MTAFYVLQLNLNFSHSNLFYKCFNLISLFHFMNAINCPYIQYDLLWKDEGADVFKLSQSSEDLLHWFGEALLGHSTDANHNLRNINNNYI